MSDLENTGPMHNSKKFTESPFWANNERDKAKKEQERKEAEDDLKRLGLM